MKRRILLASLVFLLSVPAVWAESVNDRLASAATVMQEILNVPDDIPQDLLNKAECVIVIPSVKKFAFGFGGSYGRGVMVCRTGKNFDGPFGAPSMYALEGGSFGLQLGGEATDYVLLVMNPHGVKSLLSSKVRLGADASVAGGPKGRTATAATDAWMRAEILSYSRARGVFAGISLAGSTLRPDNDANQRLYGREISARDIVEGGKVGVPAAARPLVSELRRASPRNKSA
jgi:lipid-binding SYLF domain-containing protein